MKKLQQLIKFFFAFSFFFAAGKAYSQTNTFPATGAAGIGTTTPNASSLFDVTSTTQGVLVPRMTKTQRDAIVSPATGLLIYQTNNTPGFYYYSGTAWTAVSPKGVNKALNNLSSPTAVNVDLLPGTTNTINLGNSTLRWKDVNLFNLKFADGTSQSTAAANTSLSNLSTTSVNQSLIPSSNSTLDLGSSSLNWKNIYAAGSYFIGADKVIYTDNNGNTFLGKTMTANNTGIGSTAVGSFALADNTSGLNNTAYGNGALTFNTTGNFNTATGADALFNNVDGDYNNAQGVASLNFNTSGSYNTAYGFVALLSNTTGSHNTGMGDSANVASGNLSNATAIGSRALVSASNCLVLGSINGVNGATNNVNVGIGTSAPQKRLHVEVNGLSGASALSGTGILLEDNTTTYLSILTPSSTQNGIIFGNTSSNQKGAIVFNNSNNRSGLQLNAGGVTRVIIDSIGHVGIGNFTPTHRLQLNADDAAKPSTSTWTISSDAKLKTNIADFKDGLDVLKKIHPVWFEYNGKADLPTGIKSVGIIAQEMQKIAPYMISSHTYTDTLGNATEYLDYNANALFYILVNSVKELSSKNEKLISEIGNLKTKNEEFEKRISSLENQSSMTDGYAELKTLNSKPETTLGENIPNPFDNSTLIPFRIPKDCKDASIMITNTATSEVISVIPISCNEDHVGIDSGTLASGTYSYSLYVDGKMVDTKSMTIAK